MKDTELLSAPVVLRHAIVQKGQHPIRPEITFSICNEPPISGLVLDRNFEALDHVCSPFLTFVALIVKQPSHFDSNDPLLECRVGHISHKGTSLIARTRANVAVKDAFSLLTHFGGAIF